MRDESFITCKQNYNVASKCLSKSLVVVEGRGCGGAVWLPGLSFEWQLGPFGSEAAEQRYPLRAGH